MRVKELWMQANGDPDAPPIKRSAPIPRDLIKPTQKYYILFHFVESRVWLTGETTATSEAEAISNFYHRCRQWATKSRYVAPLKRQILDKATIITKEEYDALKSIKNNMPVIRV